MNKVLIIGTSLAGKTTLVKILKSKISLPISEVDEELTQLNGGTFPVDTEYKHNVVFPKIFNWILKQKEIIFFTNTDYFSIEQLKELKRENFKIVQLYVRLGVLRERNIERQKVGYDNLEQYLEGMVGYQKIVEENGFFDYTIDGEQPVEKVIEDLLSIIKE